MNKSHSQPTTTPISEVTECGMYCDNPHCGCLHLDPDRLWRIIRAQLEWYRAIPDPDRGDLVLAEEAILAAVKNAAMPVSVASPKPTD